MTWLTFFAAIPRWAYATLAGLIALAVWLHLHDRAVIRGHEAEVTARVVAATAAANETALRNDATRSAEDAARDAAIREAIDHAVQAHPDDARRASGPVTNAVVDRLRRSQAAAGHPSR